MTRWMISRGLSVALVLMFSGLAAGQLFVGSTDGKLIALDLGDLTATGWSMWGGGPTHSGM